MFRKYALKLNIGISDFLRFIKGAKFNFLEISKCEVVSDNASRQEN